MREVDENFRDQDCEPEEHRQKREKAEKQNERAVEGTARTKEETGRVREETCETRGHNKGPWKDNISGKSHDSAEYVRGSFFSAIWSVRIST